MPTANESFDTVMAALSSNRCAQCEVALVLARMPQ